jgi:hypothetical protein
LAVVGLTLAAGAVGRSLGALLLFVTNVTAILATGTVVMAVYRVHRLTPTVTAIGEGGLHRTRAVITVFALVLIVGAALTRSSRTAIRNTTRGSKAQRRSLTSVPCAKLSCELASTPRRSSWRSSLGRRSISGSRRGRDRRPLGPRAGVSLLTPG